jgi:hypothetical protein
MVRYVCYGHDMSDIPTNAEMLDVIDKINAG